jgi:hypothetical protein
MSSGGRDICNLKMPEKIRIEVDESQRCGNGKDSMDDSTTNPKVSTLSSILVLQQKREGHCWIDKTEVDRIEF